MIYGFLKVMIAVKESCALLAEVVCRGKYAQSSYLVNAQRSEGSTLDTLCHLTNHLFCYVVAIAVSDK